MKKPVYHLFQGATLALLLGTTLYITSCSDKAEDVVAPKAAATTANVIAPGDTVSYPTDYQSTESYALASGNCAFLDVSQNGVFNGTRQVHYVPGQKVLVRRNHIIATGCSSPSTCEIWLVRGQSPQIYIATLATNFNPSGLSTAEVTLPSSMNYGNDYQLVYANGTSVISGAVYSLTVYPTKSKLMTVTPSNSAYANGSTVTATWRGDVWPAGYPVDVYVYGFGPLLADNTRTFVGTVASPGTGTASKTFTAPVTGSPYSPTRQWIVRVQDSQAPAAGNGSLQMNITY